VKKTALLALASIAAASPSMAKSHHHHYRATSHHRLYAGKSHHHRSYAARSTGSHAHITCEMVRAYVGQVGLVQARAMALSAGMTAAEERRARHCLENGA